MGGLDGAGSVCEGEPAVQDPAIRCTGQRAMAQLRPVSIPDLVSNMAGKETALETLIAADGEGDCKGIEVNIGERAKV